MNQVVGVRKPMNTMKHVFWGVMTGGMFTMFVTIPMWIYRKFDRG